MIISPMTTETRGLPDTSSDAVKQRTTPMTKEATIDFRMVFLS